jgi:hypothetical protein
MHLVTKAAIVAAMGLVGVGAGLGADALLRPVAAPAAEVVPATIGALRLAVPAAFVRGGARAGGERIDAVLRHPTFEAAASAPRGARPAGADVSGLVFLSIVKADGGIDPAERAQDLYGRFLEADAWQNPGGLLLRRFQAGSPYEDEELYLSPPDGRAFTARCRKPGKGTDLIGEACLWRHRIEGADIQVRFAPDLLPEWEALAAGVRQRVAEWAALR